MLDYQPVSNELTRRVPVVNQNPYPSFNTINYYVFLTRSSNCLAPLSEDPGTL
jgi:hypothetical protein